MCTFNYRIEDTPRPAHRTVCNEYRSSAYTILHFMMITDKLNRICFCLAIDLYADDKFIKRYFVCSTCSKYLFFRFLEDFLCMKRSHEVKYSDASNDKNAYPYTSF